MKKFRKRYKLHPKTQPMSGLPHLAPPGWKKWRGRWKRQAIGLVPTDSDCDGWGSVSGSIYDCLEWKLTPAGVQVSNFVRVQSYLVRACLDDPDEHDLAFPTI